MTAISRMMGAGAMTLCALAFSTSAGATSVVPTPVTITIDENGHGTRSDTGASLSSAMSNDPTTGEDALAYISLQVLAGDVVLSEDGQTPSDLIRFFTFPTNELSFSLIFFYSDNGDGADALADIGLPRNISENAVQLAEVGPEGNNGASYTPTANQPGFSPFFNITYHFISDASGVPEPGTWATMICGFGAMGIAMRRRRRKTLAIA